MSSLALSSITGLAKRSPDDFRATVAALSADARARMETAIREAAQASAAAQQSHTPTSAKGPGSAPKIALKMDFGGFGK